MGKSEPKCPMNSWSFLFFDFITKLDAESFSSLLRAREANSPPCCPAGQPHVSAESHKAANRPQGNVNKLGFHSWTFNDWRLSTSVMQVYARTLTFPKGSIKTASYYELWHPWWILPSLLSVLAMFWLKSYLWPVTPSKFAGEKLQLNSGENLGTVKNDTLTCSFPLCARRSQRLRNLPESRQVAGCFARRWLQHPHTPSRGDSCNLKYRCLHANVNSSHSSGSSSLLCGSACCTSPGGHARQRRQLLRNVIWAVSACAYSCMCPFPLVYILIEKMSKV